MATINISYSPAEKDSFDATMETFAAKARQLGRYTATLTGSGIELADTGNAVSFFDTSPTADASNTTELYTFLNTHPTLNEIQAYEGASRNFSTPTAQDITKYKETLSRYTDRNDLPSALAFIRNLLVVTHPHSHAQLMDQLIFPWFFKLFPNGKVLTSIINENADDYDMFLRNMNAMSLYGFDVVKANRHLAKPFEKLISSFEVRINNVVKMLTQYNAPFLDAFSLALPFGVLILIPCESVHRRALDGASLYEVTAPVSVVTSDLEIFEEDGISDTVDKIHGKRSAAQTEEWIRYWLAKLNLTFDRLYDFTRSVDTTTGNVDFRTCYRNILQYERIFFDVSWSCAPIDQITRKSISYAIFDMVVGFMSDTWRITNANNTKDTEKFISLLTSGFLLNRLPSLYNNPVLVNDSFKWLSKIYDNIKSTYLNSAFPGTLVQGGQVDLLSSYSNLQTVAQLPGSGNVISDEVYVAQVIRATRNTHHGYISLFDRPFAVLSTHSGVSSEQIASLLPFLCFAMLDRPDEAISHSW